MSTHPDSWWMGHLSAEIGAFLAGLHSLDHLRTVYRQFYASDQVQGDPEFKKWLPPPTKRKIKMRG